MEAGGLGIHAILSIELEDSLDYTKSCLGQ